MNRIDLKFPVVMLVAAGLLGACATTPQSVSELERAEAAVEALVSDSQVRRYAPGEMQEAETLLERAQERWREGAGRSDVLHLAQLTETQVGIARESAELSRLEARVDELSNQREVLSLEARAARAEREAQRIDSERSRAEAQAARSEAERMAEAARRARAEQAAREAEMERREAAQQSAMAQQEAEQQRQQRMAAEMRARELEEEARRMREEAERLQEQIAELEARPTDRGLVLTLGADVLFDLDKYQLREGAERTIDRIAEFLNEYEDRQVLVEGFTDSTGARDYNLRLSEQRAESVRDALVERGVGEDRVQTRGYGLDYPVASNETQAGRQLNRRVEVIISDDDEDVPDRSK
ncbi:MAG: OmpA family protein [Gammaproteobacteria bacterium]|jgi:outer membrane protein OmpA-like peptidoglycan-associated protein|nr:OmpA family protein [Gammaproteobacteria bacterium]